MMPDLGKYAGAVLSAYGVTIALVIALVAVSLWQGARIKRQLDRIEAEEGKNG